jgi:hypothetical protein
MKAVINTTNAKPGIILKNRLMAYLAICGSLCQLSQIKNPLIIKNILTPIEDTGSARNLKSFIPSNVYI